MVLGSQGLESASILAQRALHTRCGAVLLHVDGRRSEVVDGTDQFDWRMLEPVVVNKKPLVKVNLAAHLLGIVLIEQSDVSVQVALIVDAVQTLARPNVTKVVSFNALAVTDAFVCHGQVLGHVDVVVEVHFVVQAAEALQSTLCFHLHK